MHEASIAQSILSIGSNRLKNTANAESVLAIRVIIGEFRNVEADSLKFAFDNLKGTFEGCADCRLELDEIKCMAFCRSEKHRYNPRFEDAYRCQKCGSGIGKLIAGDELDVVGVTLQATSLKE